jgi:hypothetical protein
MVRIYYCQNLSDDVTITNITRPQGGVLYLIPLTKLCDLCATDVVGIMWLV